MRTKDKDMAVWMRRADEANLNKLKNLLGLRDRRTVSIPEALGEATRLAIAELERTRPLPKPGCVALDPKATPSPEALATMRLMVHTNLLMSGLDPDDPAVVEKYGSTSEPASTPTLRVSTLNQEASS